MTFLSFPGISSIFFLLLSISISISYASGLLNTFIKLCVCKSSAGLGGIGPQTSKSKFSMMDVFNDIRDDNIYSIELINNELQIILDYDKL